MSHDQRTPITRRSALLQTGSLAALAAGQLGSAGTAPAVAQPAPTIEHAGALILELRDVLLGLNDRDPSNVFHALLQLVEADGFTGPALAAELAALDAYIGPGRRVMDRVDREALAVA